MSPELSAAALPADVPADVVQVGVYPSFSAGSDRGLVVLAMGLPYWLASGHDGYGLFVERHAAAAVQDQLARFERESIGWPPLPIEAPSAMRGLELATPLLWAAVVLASFRAQQQWPAWTELGAMNAKAVFAQGELWRPATALFLHADFGHLVSNLFSGVFAFAAVVTTLGRARGWGLLGCAAVTGNVAMAALRSSGAYLSLGASTAVFAAVGLLTGRAVRVAARSSTVQRWRTFVPMAAGFIVLGLYGAGEQRVDVGAHFAGFAAGCCFGMLAGAPVGRTRGR